MKKINNVIRVKTGLKAGECSSELYCVKGCDRSGLDASGLPVCDIPCSDSSVCGTGPEFLSARFQK